MIPGNRQGGVLGIVTNDSTSVTNGFDFRDQCLFKNPDPVMQKK